MPITASQKVDNDSWKFQVETVPLQTPDGKKTSWFANRRVDNGEVLGVCSKRYAVVDNDTLISKAEDAFARKGMTNYERKVFVTEGGAKMRAVYDFSGDDFQMEVPKVGDVMGYRLSLQNSFDRSLRVSFALGFLRLVCTNGMQTLQKDISMVKKHSARLNLGDLLTDAAIDKSLAQYRNAMDTFASLTDLEMTQEQGLTVLQNYANSNLLSEKLREGIAQVWNNPLEHHNDGNVNEKRNGYQFYNAVTRFLTSDDHSDNEGNSVGTLESTRFELSNRTSTNVLKSLNKAVKTPSYFSKLIKPIKDDSLVIVE